MNKHNQRETLLHICCQYFNAEKKDVLFGVKNKYRVYSATGVFLYLAVELWLGTRAKIMERCNKSEEILVRCHKKYSRLYEVDIETKDDIDCIRNLFLIGEKAIMPEYYLRRIPKNKMADFIKHIESFNIEHNTVNIRMYK